MNALPKTIPSGMTVDDFLAWPGDGSGRAFQLVDGEPRALAHSHLGHGIVLAGIGFLLENHFVRTGSSNHAAMRVGVIPRVKADTNMRVPDLGVTAVPATADQWSLPDPVLLVDVLSPEDEAETRQNIWAYATIPSLREILVLHSVRIAAELLRRQPDSAWPEGPDIIGAEGVLILDSVGFSCPLREVYARTHLGRAAPRPASR